MKTRLRGALLALGLVLAACGEQEGRSAGPGAPPQEAALPLRVAAWSPLAADFVRQIGAEALLVAIGPRAASRPGWADAEPRLRTSWPELPGRVPDLVLAATAEPPDDASAERLRQSGAEWVHFAPHDLEDATQLVREVGTRLVGAAAAHRFEIRFSRALAEVGGASHGQRRPRAVGIVTQPELRVAGGHSFETDLLEIAGATSVTHGGEDSSLPLRADQLAALAPEVAFVFSARPLSELRRAELRAELYEVAGELPALFFDFERESFWLREDPARAARQLRLLVQEFAASASAPEFDAPEADE